MDTDIFFFSNLLSRFIRHTNYDSPQDKAKGISLKAWIWWAYLSLLHHHLCSCLDHNNQQYMECESFHFQAAGARIVSSERHMIGELQIAAKVLVLANARPGREIYLIIAK
jgi:hypothetical protein